MNFIVIIIIIKKLRNARQRESDLLIDIYYDSSQLHFRYDTVSVDTQFPPNQINYTDECINECITQTKTSIIVYMPRQYLNLTTFDNTKMDYLRFFFSVNTLP